MSTEVKTVLVTGASGYIGSHVVRQLLEGGYDVKGTVRSLSNEKKLAPLKGLPLFERLQLVEADLLDPASIHKAVEGCSHVLHVASPFPVNHKGNDQEVVGPAVEGTKAVLQACHDHKVKRLVLTSSSAAIIGDTKDRDPGKVLTEKDWGAENTENVYFRSKILAEKAAWDFHKNLDEKDRFELVVMNPSMVQGPSLGSKDATSFEFAKILMERQMPLVPNLFFPCVDVRDVAQAHVKGLTLPEAAGHRHILSNKGFWVKDIAVILDKEFSSMGYRIPTTSCPDFLLRIYSFFDPLSAAIVPHLGKQIKIDNTRMRTVLGVEPISFDKTVRDMGHSLVQCGIVHKTPAYQLKSYL